MRCVLRRSEGKTLKLGVAIWRVPIQCNRSILGSPAVILPLDLASDSNTIVPAELALLKRRRRDHGRGLVSLLGLVAMHEERGVEWQSEDHKNDASFSMVP
jgi:hypothetical protein